MRVYGVLWRRWRWTQKRCRWHRDPDVWLMSPVKKSAWLWSRRPHVYCSFHNLYDEGVQSWDFTHTWCFQQGLIRNSSGIFRHNVGIFRHNVGQNVQITFISRRMARWTLGKMRDANAPVKDVRLSHVHGEKQGKSSSGIEKCVFNDITSLIKPSRYEVFYECFLMF